MASSDELQARIRTKESPHIAVQALDYFLGRNDRAASSDPLSLP